MLAKSLAAVTASPYNMCVKHVYIYAIYRMWCEVGNPWLFSHALWYGALSLSFSVSLSLAVSQGANDWTVDIETHGLPSLRHIYHLFGCSSDAVEATHLDFEHNYNARSREKM